MSHCLPPIQKQVEKMKHVDKCEDKQSLHIFKERFINKFVKLSFLPYCIIGDKIKLIKYTLFYLISGFRRDANEISFLGFYATQNPRRAQIQ
jgi:hypothetical protein